jgi:inner membrane protein
MLVDFAYDFRGNAALSLAPHGGRHALARPLVLAAPELRGRLPALRSARSASAASTPPTASATSRWDDRWSAPATRVAGMVERVAPPSREPMVATPITTRRRAGPDRADQPDPAGRPLFAGQPGDKYGFLFIGFTFLALLMFDVIGGVRSFGGRISADGRGAGAVLRAPARARRGDRLHCRLLLASAAIAGLNTAYSAAVLGSWRRAAFIGGLLVGLYACSTSCSASRLTRC